MPVAGAGHIHRLMHHHDTQLRRIRAPQLGHHPLNLRERDFAIFVPPAARGFYTDDPQQRRRDNVFKTRPEGSQTTVLAFFSFPAAVAWLT